MIQLDLLASLLRVGLNKSAYWWRCGLWRNEVPKDRYYEIYVTSDCSCGL